MNFKTLREKERALLQDLDTVRAAMKLLGGEAGSDKSAGKKTRRKMSPETRARMAKAARARWAKVAKKE